MNATSPIHRAVVVAALLAMACGAPARPAARSERARPTSVPRARVEPATSAPVAAAPTACATVHIGLDLRALPRNSSTGGIDMFVGGQASDFVAKAPAGTPPEIRASTGFGGFEATFRDATPADAHRRCEQSVQSYLATAPRLPIIMEPAAQVVEACRPCP